MSSPLPPPSLPAFLLLLFSSLPHLFVVPVHSAFPYARCFQKSERHSIDNSQPLTEIFRTSPLDCLEQCITHTGNGDDQEDPGYCRSVVFDHLHQSCRLYDHDGRKVPAVVNPANGFDIYRRVSSMQECVGPIQRLLALNARRGAVFAAPSQKNNRDKVKTGPIPIPHKAQTAEESLTDEELATLLDQLEVKGGSGGVHENAVVGAEGATSPELDCATLGRATGYLEYIGGQPAEGAEEFMGWSESACARFCTSNLDPEGTEFPCAGFSHQPAGSKCFLHAKVSSKVLIQRPPAPYAGIYAEKWCVPSHRYGICRESAHFPVRLQQRFAPACIPLVSLEQVPSLTECLAKCMDQRICQTTSFHSPSRRCLLYSQLPLSNLIIPADQGWIMAQNGCGFSGREGLVRAVDSEDGEIEPRTASVGSGGGPMGTISEVQAQSPTIERLTRPQTPASEGPIQPQSPANEGPIRPQSPARVFGLPNRPCNEAEGGAGGGGLMELLEGGGRMLTNMLTG